MKTALKGVVFILTLFVCAAFSQTIFKNSTNGEVMRVTQSGDLGIGYSAPVTKLHVQGNENDGTTATVKIVSGAQTMLIDGNEIDSDAGLYLNYNKGGVITIGATTGSVRAVPLTGTGNSPVYAGADGTLNRYQSNVRGFIPYQKMVFSNGTTFLQSGTGAVTIPWSATIDVKTALGSAYPQGVTHLLFRVLQDMNPTDFPSGSNLRTHVYPSGGAANVDNWVITLDTYNIPSEAFYNEVTETATFVVPVTSAGTVVLEMRWFMETPLPTYQFDLYSYAWVEGFYVTQ